MSWRAYQKAWVALVLAILTLIELYTGVDIAGIAEGWWLALLAVLQPILVYAVPNRA